MLRHLNFGWLHAPPFPPACCHCLMLSEGDQVVLVDTGIGLQDIADPLERIGRDAIAAPGFQFLSSATAARQLAELGHPPHAVTDIVLTHCDPDHVGGLSDFPHANVHLSAEELANVESGNPRYRPQQFAPPPRWRVYRDDDADFFNLPSRTVATALNTDVRLVPLPGHTAGHCGVAARDGESWVLHVGDAYYLRAELSELNHPVDELAALRADNDALRRESLAQLRELHKRAAGSLSMFGYHGVGELPAGIPRLDELA